MIRILLQVVVPILLPFVVYFAYVYFVRRRRPDVEVVVPWHWLGAASVVLVVLTLGAIVMFGGEEPGQTYVPPRTEDGKIVPGHFE